MGDRAKLWNAVEAAELRKDARLAKEVEFSLPRELEPAARLEAARKMAAHFLAKGHIVDLAIHDDGQNHNPHCHLMLATRSVSAAGFGAKLRDSDSLAFVTEARAKWAAIANEALGKVGSGVEIDARSNKVRGIEERPGQHKGPDRAAKRKTRQPRRETMTADQELEVRIAALEAENARFRAEMAEREQRAEAERPVPDPDGRPIAPVELERAQQAMVDEMQRPAREMPETPYAGRVEVNKLAQAQQAIDAKNESREPLGWLDDQSATREAVQEPRPPDPLDWMRGQDTGRDQEEENEWDRDR